MTSSLDRRSGPMRRCVAATLLSSGVLAALGAAVIDTEQVGAPTRAQLREDLARVIAFCERQGTPGTSATLHDDIGSICRAARSFLVAQGRANHALPIDVLLLRSSARGDANALDAALKRAEAQPPDEPWRDAVTILVGRMPEATAAKLDRAQFSRVVLALAQRLCDSNKASSLFKRLPTTDVGREALRGLGSKYAECAFGGDPTRETEPGRWRRLEQLVGPAADKSGELAAWLLRNKQVLESDDLLDQRAKELLEAWRTAPTSIESAARREVLASARSLAPSDDAALLIALACSEASTSDAFIAEVLGRADFMAPATRVLLNGGSGVTREGLDRFANAVARADRFAMSDSLRARFDFVRAWRRAPAELPMRRRMAEWEMCVHGLCDVLDDRPTLPYWSAFCFPPFDSPDLADHVAAFRSNDDGRNSQADAALFDLVPAGWLDEESRSHQDLVDRCSAWLNDDEWKTWMRRDPSPDDDRYLLALLLTGRGAWNTHLGRKALSVAVMSRRVDAPLWAVAVDLARNHRLRFSELARNAGLGESR